VALTGIFGADDKLGRRRRGVGVLVGAIRVRGVRVALAGIFGADRTLPEAERRRCRRRSRAARGGRGDDRRRVDEGAPRHRGRRWDVAISSLLTPVNCLTRTEREESCAAGCAGKERGGRHFQSPDVVLGGRASGTVVRLLLRRRIIAHDCTDFGSEAFTCSAQCFVAISVVSSILR
jgi:hypothetical protein